MATPEAEFLRRLEIAQSMEDSAQEDRRPSFSQIMTRRSMELHQSPEMRAIDSLQAVLDTISGPSHEEEKTRFFNMLSILHEEEPDVYPSPDEVIFPEEGTPFIARGEPGSSEHRGTLEERNALRDVWFSNAVHLGTQTRRRRQEIESEILKNNVLGFGRAIGTSIGGVDEFIRERDPTQGAREEVRERVSEAPGAIAELLQAAGSRIAEGVGTARETLGQGARDLGFLLEQFIIDEIIGSGEGSRRPFSNPRARRAERFAGRDPDSPTFRR